MISLFTASYPTATLTYIQSTYVELVTELELHRVDVLGKVEARLKRGTSGPLAYHSNHWLLAFYQEPRASLALSRPPADAAALMAGIDQLVTQLPGGWRDQWVRGQAIQPKAAIRQVLERGRGNLLSYVPQILAEEVDSLCRLHGATTALTTGLPLPSSLSFIVKPPLSVLTIGNNYIIARDFYVSTRWSASGNTSQKDFPYAIIG